VGFTLGVTGLEIACVLVVLKTIMALSRQNGALRIPTFLLMGVAVSASLWGVVTLLLVLAGEDLSRALYWLFGGLLNADWQRLEWVAVPAVVGGALMLVWADTLARTLARPVELPVGVITALVGTPLFVWVMRAQAR